MEMERFAFKMHLNPGMAAEYLRRHDAIWPDLVALLHEAGVRNYSIFLDEPTHTLFAVLERPKDHGMDDLPNHPLMQKWWAHMRDIMQTHASGAPIATPLTETFHMA
jgi:L-rhamnose mutarotase